VPNPAPAFDAVTPDVLDTVGELPCDVFLVRRGRPVLYATKGAEAADVIEKNRRGLALCIRTEDRELLRRGLSNSVPRILSNQNLSPVERSRRAYGVVAQVMAPIFSSNNRVDRAGLDDAGRAIDAITGSLLKGDDLVWSMVSTMSRHLATHTHAINTAVFAVLIAERMRFGSDETHDIGRGALLHDLGKNRIPPAVLDKPGPLNAEEWALMRTHPQVGYDLVVRAMGAAPSYAHIIAEHHERADGSGYPQQRLGGEVAQSSQLVAIADAYDALTSARSYKAASSSYGALWTMRFRMRGQFDPRLLAAFVESLGGWAYLRKADRHSLELPASTG
jgi:HD-GYP domain-containing protein (c-di-GMP phosphodiesterase class II)